MKKKKSGGVARVVVTFTCPLCKCITTDEPHRNREVPWEYTTTEDYQPLPYDKVRVVRCSNCKRLLHSAELKAMGLMHAATPDELKTLERWEEKARHRAMAEYHERAAKRLRRSE